MIAIISYIFLMIPLTILAKYKLLNQFVYIVLFIFILLSNCSSFFCKISYFIGLDYFSYNLILICLLISSFIVISMYGSTIIGFFLFINFLLIFFLYLIFCSLNFLYIYISFEFVLVPLLILIFGWGYQPERLLAGIYLFFYTLLVSLPLLMLLLYLYIIYGSIFFDILIFNSYFFLIHFIFFIVFIVKIPIFIVHFWLPKAHVQSPVSGSIILAALILKIGGYGLIRVSYIYEFMYINYSYIWFSLSIVGSCIIGLICLVQGDLKCIIAYSSISHIGLVIIGLITIRSWGLLGSFILILGHGYCSSALFYIANLFYVRTGSRRFYINKGLLFYIPRGSILFFILCSFNIRCPPRLNFIREFMILISIVRFWITSILFFIFISFFCACFRYYLYRYTQHGIYRNIYSFSYLTVIEILCLTVHLFPLLFYPLILTRLL